MPGWQRWGEPWEFMRDVRDRRQMGRFPPWPATVLATRVAAWMAGCRKVKHVRQLASHLSQELLRRIGARVRPQTGRSQMPSQAS